MKRLPPVTPLSVSCRGGRCQVIVNMNREISHLNPKDGLMLCQTHKLPTIHCPAPDPICLLFNPEYLSGRQISAQMVAPRAHITGHHPEVKYTDSPCSLFLRPHNLCGPGSHPHGPPEKGGVWGGLGVGRSK